MARNLFTPVDIPHHPTVYPAQQGLRRTFYALRELHETEPTIFHTKALADAAVGDYANGQWCLVRKDETRSDQCSRYERSGGAWVYREEGRLGQIRAITHGDSVNTDMWHMLSTLHGVAGGVMSYSPPTGVTGDVTPTAQVYNTGLGVSSATAGVVTELSSQWDRWPGGTVWDCTTGTVRLGSAAFSYNTSASEIIIYYIKENGAGSFDFKRDGVSVATGNADNGGAPELGVLRYKDDRTSVAYTMDVTGDITIVLSRVVNAPYGGLVVLSVGSSGYLLADQMQNATARSLYAAMIADWNPDLIAFNMKEMGAADVGASGESNFTTALSNLCDIFDNAPMADKLFATNNPGTGTSAANNTGLVRQNEIIKAECISRGSPYLFLDTYNQFGADFDDVDVDLGFHTSGDGIHLTTVGGAYSAHTALNRFGMMTHPWGFNPLPVNASQRASHLADETTIGTRGTFAGHRTDWRFGLPGENIDKTLEVGRRIRIASDNGSVLFQASTVPTTPGFETMLPSNGQILLDGDRTRLDTNRTLGGIKGVRLWDKTSNDAAPIEAFFVAHPTTVAGAPSHQTGLIAYLTDGASGAGLYVSNGAAWVFIA